MGKENYVCALEKDSKRPCPDCGSTALAYDWTRRDRKHNKALDVYIICRNCGRRTHAYKTVEDAIAEWNG